MPGKRSLVPGGRIPWLMKLGRWRLGGDGYDGPDDWYEALAEGLMVSFDKWATQPNYLTIMYEAKAMSAQFRQYAPVTI